MAGFWDTIDSGLNWLGTPAGQTAQDLIGTGINAYSGFKTRAAAEEAAQQQEGMSREAIAGFRPYAELGDYSAGELEGRLRNNMLKDFSLEDFRASPGYQHRLSEGNKAIDRARGSKGGRYSGATLKALQRYSQNLADEEFGDAFSRDDTNKRRVFNMLSSGANIGQNVAGQTGRYLSGIGDTRATGTANKNNALTDLLQRTYESLRRPADSTYGRNAMAVPAGSTRAGR